MNRFALLEAKYNAKIHSAHLANDVCLTVFPERVVISYCSHLPKAEAIVGVAMMFGVLDLGWQGQRFLFRFPQLSDPIPLRAASRRARKDYRSAWRWAGKYLIPEFTIRSIRREQPDVREIVEELRVPPDLLGYRLGVIIPPGIVGSAKEVA